VRHYAQWIIGVSALLAACAVNPVTPAAVKVGGAAADLASATATLGVAAVAAASATSHPAATEAAGAAVVQPSATMVAPSATAGAIGSPTPGLIVVADVALVPAPTATTPPVALVVVRPKPTAVAGPQPTQAPAAPVAVVAPPASADVTAGELYTVDLINAQRAALGLAPLSANPTLMGIANSRVADMVARGYTGHNDPVTGAALGPELMLAAGFHPVGENWYGSRLGPPSIADVAMRWFMTDAAHYQNILNPRYTGVGVGIAYNGQQWLLIQDFGGS